MTTVACALALTLALHADIVPPTVPLSPPSDAPTSVTSPADTPPAADEASAGERRGRPLHDLFTNLGRDIARLPSPETAVVIGASLGGASLLIAADDGVSQWARRQGRSDHAQIGRWLGDGWVQTAAALATYGGGVWSGDEQTRRVGSDLIRAQALNALVTRGTKAIARRRRPTGGDAADSLPSGHTSASFTTAAVLHSHLGPRIGIPAYVVAGFVGWTRVRDRAHWPTDVVIGGAIGAAIGHTVARRGRPRARRWEILPTAGADHVAVHVSRVPTSN